MGGDATEEEGWCETVFFTQEEGNREENTEVQNAAKTTWVVGPHRQVDWLYNYPCD